MTLRTLAAAAACLAIATPACSPYSGPPVAADVASPDDPVVAEIDGAPLRQSELDAWIKDEWFARESEGGNPSRLYEMRSHSLERMIDARVVDAEARRRQLDAEALVQQEVAALDPVSEEEIGAFYTENKERVGDRSLEELAPQIRRYLENQRRVDAVAALRERARVRLLLEPPRVEVAAEGPVLGPGDASVTIIEFSDFQCPFCQRALDTIKGIREKYPEQVRIVYRHLPLDRIHSRARAAAEASACADDQGSFWKYHDALFANNKALSNEDLRRYAADLELDLERFEQCLGEPSAKARVEADIAAAQAAGITSTPSFVVDGVVITGARPVEDFVPLIEAALQRASRS
jgi:protein-disulfide isomerase